MPVRGRTETRCDNCGQPCRRPAGHRGRFECNWCQQREARDKAPRPTWLQTDLAGETRHASVASTRTGQRDFSAEAHRILDDMIAYGTLAPSKYRQYAQDDEPTDRYEGLTPRVRRSILAMRANGLLTETRAGAFRPFVHGHPGYQTREQFIQRFAAEAAAGRWAGTAMFDFEDVTDEIYAAASELVAG